MELAVALSPFIAVAGTLGGIWLGHVLGRRVAKNDRVMELERAAIADTREWLLDVLDVLVAASERDWWAVWRRGRAVRDKRYPRQYPELIVDGRLIDELTTTLPSAYEALPRVPPDLASRLGRIRYIVNRAMLDQERELERAGRPRIASEADQQRLLDAAERIQRRTEQLHGGRRRVLFVVRTLVPWP